MTVRQLPDGRVVDFGDLPGEQIDQIIAKQTSPAAAPSWAGTLGREAGIVGAGLLAPSAGLLHRIPGVGNYVPSYEGTLALGPTPQGSAEHILSMAAQGGGYALPAAALLLGGTGYAAPLAAAGGLFASTAIGTGAGEAVRQYTDWPPWAQMAVGAAAGGSLGSLGSGAAGAISPLGSMARGVGAGILGGAVDYGLRGLAGVSPTLSYIGGQLADVLALGKMSGMQAPAMVPTVAGGMGGLLMGPPPQSDAQKP